MNTLVGDQRFGHQRRQVEDQGDGAVAEDGGPGEPGRGRASPRPATGSPPGPGRPGGRRPRRPAGRRAGSAAAPAARGSGPSVRNKVRSEIIGTSSPRTETQGRSWARAGAVPFSDTHSSTWARGTTNLPPAVSTSRPSIRARVSGRRKMNDGPLARRALDRQAAAEARTESRTTSSPTPRPDSSLTLSRVENPARRSG